jgi:hypothetical protein
MDSRNDSTSFLQLQQNTTSVLCWFSSTRAGRLTLTPVLNIRRFRAFITPVGCRARVSHDLLNPSIEAELNQYVVGVVGAFANDTRILGWDIWNEPDNKGGDQAQDVAAKVKRVNELLPKAFEWARSAHPSQPLTSGVWQGNWSDPKLEGATTKIQLALSDIISFHNYDWPEGFEARIHELLPLHRPLLCTEYMARGAGSTFDGSLPIAKSYRVAAINWGLVAGKTQTYLPWDSWERPYVLIQPTIWFHEVFRADGTPYRQHEVNLIRQLTVREKENQR